jgi:alpha-methylacyl-CoA racemase
VSGPLDGLRVVQIGATWPASFCAMLLGDMGADVVCVDPSGSTGAAAPPWLPKARFDITARGRRYIALDLAQRGATDEVLRLVTHADALIEGYRPGIMEEFGLSPEVCMQRNPGLVYGRLTGWGQHGPLSQAAGHDITYAALSGALHAIGQSGQAPSVPLNYVGHHGGGAMMLAFGLLCGVVEARQSGCGQVVDAAMSDGCALLSASFYGLKAAGLWNNERGENLLDGGAHFYTTYVCADGKHIAVGALEPPFYAELLRRCGIAEPAFDAQFDAHSWPMLKLRLSDLFRSRTRDEWCELLEGSEACFAPVLDWDEAPMHPHHRAREAFLEIDGVVQPAPAPRFSRTPTAHPRRLECAVSIDEISLEWARRASTRGAPASARES